MRIYEFIDKFCQDLVEKAQEKRSLVDLSEFPHDDIITDVSGAKVPVVYIEGEAVPIGDFLSLDKKDFCSAWKLASSGETYDQYISLLEITEGADAVNRIRNSILAERDRLSGDVEYISTI